MVIGESMNIVVEMNLDLTFTDQKLVTVQVMNIVVTIVFENLSRPAAPQG